MTVFLIPTFLSTSFFRSRRYFLSCDPLHYYYENFLSRDHLSFQTPILHTRSTHETSKTSYVVLFILRGTKPLVSDIPLLKPKWLILIDWCLCISRFKGDFITVPRLNHPPNPFGVRTYKDPTSFRHSRSPTVTRVSFIVPVGILCVSPRIKIIMLSTSFECHLGTRDLWDDLVDYPDFLKS